ncbi:MAG: hypothetical protein Hens3KO_13290 [Henriciella sp.]
MHKYSVYLLKDDVSDPNQALTEKALALFPSNAEEVEVDAHHNYDDVECFVFHTDPDLPKWSRVLDDVGDLPDEIRTSRSGALFFANEGGRWFVFTFGDGVHHLDKRKVHMDFGLRTAINMLDSEAVKSREAIDISRSQRGAAQAALPTAFRDLGEYDTITIVKSISGKLEEAGTVSGSSSLKFASEKGICDLSEDLFGCLKAYSSDAYKDTDFAVIDKLQPVKDKTFTKALDSALAEAVAAQSGEIELVVPLLLTHQNDVSYVRFMSIQVSPPPEYLDASIRNYIDALPSGTAITGQSLKQHRLMAHDQDGAIVHYASVYKCLVGTIESAVSGETRKYVINEGDWFAVSDDFKSSVDDFFQELRDRANDEEFSPLRIIQIDKKGKIKSGFEAELTYNERIAAENSLVSMDQKFVSTPGIPGPGLELCDLLDVQNKRLIHVKKGSTQSSVLSHFFNQGVNPIQFYLGDSRFKQRAIDKVTEQSQAAGAYLAANDLSEFSVHFLLLDYPRADGSFNIPFFSRITLFDKAREFRSLVSGASISFVTPQIED